MPTNFEAALVFVLRWEGGFVDHRSDPGGRTNKGITQAVYDRWRAERGQVAQGVELIGDDEVRAIYETDYWRRAHCDALLSPLDLVHFDTAVNMGTGRAVRFLQSTVGCAVDGGFGPNTRDAVARCDQGQAVGHYCQTREDYYRKLVVARPEMTVFLKGWLNRLNALRKVAGLPGFERVEDRLDFGDRAYIGRVPDLGEAAAYDF